VYALRLCGEAIAIGGKNLPEQAFPSRWMPDFCARMILIFIYQCSTLPLSSTDFWGNHHETLRNAQIPV
jgi:hypothetical protein